MRRAVDSAMSDLPSAHPHAGVDPDTRAAFAAHLHATPNKRRVSQAEQETLVHWLTSACCNSGTSSTTICPFKPLSQKEFSRRHYVKKSFVWDKDHEALVAIPRGGSGRERRVVLEDAIPDTVAKVHEQNGHAGWDATWRDVSKAYYGILRADVIFLLKLCPTCAQNPRKQPKNRAAAVQDLVDVQPSAYDDDISWALNEHPLGSLLLFDNTDEQAP